MRHWIPFQAVVKARPRLGRRRKVFTPQKTTDYENAVRKWWTENADEHWDAYVPLGIEVEIHQDGFYIEIFELEASVRPVGVLGDIDNYLKAIQDALQPNKNDPEGLAGAFPNDRMIELVDIRFCGVPRKPRKSKVPPLEDVSGGVPPSGTIRKNHAPKLAHN